MFVMDKDGEKKYQYRKMLKYYKYKKYELGSFSRCALVLWNSLPPVLRLASTVPGFKSGLKTYPCKRAYNFQT